MDSPCESNEEQVAPCLWGSESFWTYVDSNPSLFDGYSSDGNIEYNLADALCYSTEFKCLLSQKVSFIFHLLFAHHLLSDLYLHVFLWWFCKVTMQIQYN